MTEVRFIPEDRGLLEAMFHAMSVCQTLHPDPNDSVSDGILDYILKPCCLLIMFTYFVLEGDYDDGEEEGEYCLANAEAGGELGENGMFF